MGKTIVSDHARIELEKLDEEQVLVDGYTEVIAAFERLKSGLEGTEVENAISVLTALFRGEHISPLTNDPAEWRYYGSSRVDAPNGVWQSTRNPNAFSHDNGDTYYLTSRGGKLVNWRDRREYRCARVTDEG